MKVLSTKEPSALNDLDREVANNISRIKDAVRVATPKAVSGELHNIYSHKELADLIVLAAVQKRIDKRDPRRVEDIRKLLKVGS